LILTNTLSARLKLQQAVDEPKLESVWEEG